MDWSHVRTIRIHKVLQGLTEYASLGVDKFIVVEGFQRDFIEELGCHEILIRQIHCVVDVDIAKMLLEMNELISAAELGEFVYFYRGPC